MGALTTVFETHVDRDVATLRVIGDTVARDRIAAFHDTVAGLVQRGSRTVVIDLSTARGFGAAMLGELVAALQAVTGAGGRLLLTGLPRQADRVLKAARLDAVLLAEPVCREGERTDRTDGRVERMRATA